MRRLRNIAFLEFVARPTVSTATKRERHRKEKRWETEGKGKRRERARDGTSESARRAEVAFSLHSYLVSYNPVHAIESGHLHGSAYIMKHRNEQEEVQKTEAEEDADPCKRSRTCHERSHSL